MPQKARAYKHEKKNEKIMRPAVSRDDVVSSIGDSVCHGNRNAAGDNGA